MSLSLRVDRSPHIYTYHHRLLQLLLSLPTLTFHSHSRSHFLSPLIRTPPEVDGPKEV